MDRKYTDSSSASGYRTIVASQPFSVAASPRSGSRASAGRDSGRSSTAATPFAAQSPAAT